MALCHFHVGHIGRAGGQSAIASAAYRAGEELYSEYYGETNDFTRKGGVTYTEIMLPPNAPPEYKASAGGYDIRSDELAFHSRRAFPDPARFLLICPGS